MLVSGDFERYLTQLFDTTTHNWSLLVTRLSVFKITVTAIRTRFENNNNLSLTQKSQWYTTDYH